MKNDTILIVAAHPDDEILGCGATVAKFVEQGCKAYALILGEGKTSRSCTEKNDELVQLKEEARAANSEIGVTDVFFADFPDNKFDTVPLLDIVKKIEEVKEKIKPSVIFTHYLGDLNIDHKITYNAVITATRPMRDETVKTIYAFEILSSTEWSFPLSFSPNIFINVTDSFDEKLSAMKRYDSELREYPHPRSLRAIEIEAQNLAYKVGIDGRIEAFNLIRHTQD